VADPVEMVSGARVVILFEAKRCIHSRGCVLSRPDVFVPNVDGEWLHPDVATPEELIETARGCPSGAIRVRRLDGGPEEGAPLVNVIRVRENGPLAVHADIRLALGENETTSEPRMTLCRCGQSRNKPFCDGTHKMTGFVATGEAADGDKDELPARDGPLRIAPSKNGPLLVTGNVEICTGTGRTLAKVGRAALCRCGGSGNKPFCDGTHRKISFVSE
jgi:CDGSH-type Zn-finger protein/uncharacterized Fe-S cluster protein YjdI